MVLKQKHHSRGVWWGEVAQLLAARKHREGTKRKDSPFRRTPETYLLSRSLPSKSSLCYELINEFFFPLVKIELRAYVLSYILVFLFFETGFCEIAYVGLELNILLPQPPKALGL